MILLNFSLSFLRWRILSIIFFVLSLKLSYLFCTWNFILSVCSMFFSRFLAFHISFLIFFSFSLITVNDKDISASVIIGICFSDSLLILLSFLLIFVTIYSVVISSLAS